MLVGIGFARATPPAAEIAIAATIESVSFEDILALLVRAGSVPAGSLALHQFSLRFMAQAYEPGRQPTRPIRPGTVSRRRAPEKRQPASPLGSTCRPPRPYRNFSARGTGGRTSGSRVWR